MNDELSSRQKRLQFLARKNHRHVILDRYLEALSKQLGISISRDNSIGLEQSDAITHKFFTLIADKEKPIIKIFSAQDISAGEVLIRKIVEQIPNKNYYFITDNGENIIKEDVPFNTGYKEVGIFTFAAQPLLADFKLALLKKNTKRKLACATLGIYDEETHSGIFIDYEDGCGGNVDCCSPVCLEIRIFGTEWKKYAEN